MSFMLDLHGYGWLLFDGLQLTIAVGLCAMVVAVLLGLLGSWGKLAQNRWANFAANTYTTVIRGVPELILLLLLYFGTPTLIQSIATSMGYDIRVDINPFIAGTITIGFIYGAFSTELGLHHHRLWRTCAP